MINPIIQICSFCNSVLNNSLYHSRDTSILFTGQRLDQTRLYFYNARYYDANIGRFISADTVIPNPANPQSFNRYSYCLNNPLKYIDPSGHIVICEDNDIQKAWADFSVLCPDIAGMLESSPTEYNIQWGDIKAAGQVEGYTIKLNKDALGWSNRAIIRTISHEVVHLLGNIIDLYQHNSQWEEVLAHSFQNEIRLAIGGPLSWPFGYIPLNPQLWPSCIRGANVGDIDFSDDLSDPDLYNDINGLLGGSYNSLDVLPMTESNTPAQSYAWLLYMSIYHPFNFGSGASSDYYMFYMSSPPTINPN